MFFNDFYKEPFDFKGYYLAANAFAVVKRKGTINYQAKI